MIGWGWFCGVRSGYGSRDDHLGSISDDACAFDPLPEAEPQPMQRYYPYGATRSGYAVSVSYQYTGQRHEAALGLYYYNARWWRWPKANAKRIGGANSP